MLHPGRYLEGPGRVSGRKTGRFPTRCETLHSGRYPEGFPEAGPEGFVQFSIFVGSSLSMSKPEGSVQFPYVL